MYKYTILLFFVALASGSYKFVKHENQLEETQYPENFTTLETLKEFVRLVDEHKLNVSLILSSGKNWEDGNLKEAIAMTITFPVNEESISKGTLDKEAFDKLVAAANKDKLTVAGTVGKNNKLTVYTNNRKGLPITKSYKIFTGIKNGQTGFVFDDKNYVAQYTFIVPGEDGKNETTRILWGDAQVEVVDKSANIKDTELATIKKALVDAYFTYDDEILPKALVDLLDKQLPDHSWEAASGVGENNYVDSNYWATLKILDDNILVYSS